MGAGEFRDILQGLDIRNGNLRKGQHVVHEVVESRRWCSLLGCPPSRASKYARVAKETEEHLDDNVVGRWSDSLRAEIGSEVRGRLSDRTHEKTCGVLPKDPPAANCL
jgi:hypothetical protein